LHRNYRKRDVYVPRIGFFTRLLEEGTAAQRYGWALEQIQQAERAGFSTAWIAQHHFNADEGGLPTPWPFLGAAAQATQRIRLGTAVVTLPHENPVRTAEDAAVLDILSGGRFELGIAPGASPQNLDAMGYTNTNARERFAEQLPVLRAALAGEPLGEAGLVMQPVAEGLGTRIWQATFSENGATRAAQAGDGLMLSRIQPGSEVGELVGDLQMSIIDTYHRELAEGATPRILASRTAVVVDGENRDAALKHLRTRVATLAERNLRRNGAPISAAELTDTELLRYTGTYFGTVDEVVEQLRGDQAAQAANEVSFQVHSLDPGHEITMRSIELLGTRVAPALGWTVEV